MWLGGWVGSPAHNITQSRPAARMFLPESTAPDFYCWNTAMPVLTTHADAATYACTTSPVYITMHGCMAVLLCTTALMYTTVNAYTTKPLHNTAAATQARSACTTSPVYNTLRAHTTAAARTAATGACVHRIVYAHHRARAHVEDPDEAQTPKLVFVGGGGRERIKSEMRFLCYYCFLAALRQLDLASCSSCVRPRRRRFPEPPENHRNNDDDDDPDDDGKEAEGPLTFQYNYRRASNPTSPLGLGGMTSFSSLFHCPSSPSPPPPLGLDGAPREGLERPRWPKMAPRGLQMLQDGLQDGSRYLKMAQDGFRHTSKRPQDRSKMVPSALRAFRGTLHDTKILQKP